MAPRCSTSHCVLAPRMSQPLDRSSLARPAGVIDYVLLFGLAAAWGASFPLIKLGVATVPAVSMTALRLVVASLVLTAIAVAAGERMPRNPRLWRLILIVVATGNVVPYVLIAWGQERVDSGVAAILMAVMPLMTVLFAHVLTRDEKLNGGKLAGLALGFAGLLVLIGPDKLSTLGIETVRQLAIAAAAACYGYNAIVTKQLVGTSQLAVIATVMVVSALIMVPAAFILDDVAAITPSTTSILTICALGGIQTALGTITLFEIVRRQGASFFSMINFLVPVSGVVWSSATLGERLPANALIALVLILAGVALVRSGLGANLWRRD